MEDVRTKTGLEWSHGGVVRGSRDRKRISLVFTGGDFGEGLIDVIEALEDHDARGSFFFTGDFLRDPMNRDGILRARSAGHYLGPHSDKHLLYCSWERRDRTLVRREQFLEDLHRNLTALERFGVTNGHVTWWIPPFEWYNEEVAAWAREAGYPLFSFTPGTLSHADYTEEGAKNYRSSDEILSSILGFEAREEDGLNGFLLLSHVGAGGNRKDKFFLRLDGLIEQLKRRGYRFVGVREMLGNGR